MLTVTKVISQDFVCALDDMDRNILLRGKRLGFTKDLGSVERTYFIDDKVVYKKMQKVIKEIPVEYIEICDKIIDYAKERYNVELGMNLYLCLPDHMSFAIERQRQKIVYENTVVKIIEKYYKTYFDIAKYGAHLLQKCANMIISKDEIGFIALHIMNISFNADMNEIIEMLNFVQSAMEELADYNVKMGNRRLIEVIRLEEFVKETARRLFTSHKLILDIDKKIYIGNIWSKEYRCAKRISNIAEVEYGKNFTKKEIYRLYKFLMGLSQKKMA